MNFGSCASSFARSVRKVPGCCTGIGLPGAGAAGATTGASDTASADASSAFAFELRDCRQPMYPRASTTTTPTMIATVIVSRPRVSIAPRARATVLANSFSFSL
jgi:hypothetical protein